LQGTDHRRWRIDLKPFSQSRRQSKAYFPPRPFCDKVPRTVAHV
jgi:hypothetical protein